MRHLALIASLTVSLTAAAWNVTTEPTKRNALIEEFTGIHCMNCPDGHHIAAAIINLHEGDVYTVAYHSGYFSGAYPGEPNFVTETGQAIHDRFDVSSYPSAVVNRMDLGNGVVQGRGSWGPSCREVGKLNSPVNIWASSAYDADSRKFSIDVEGYMTEGMNDPRINVFLLQNEVLGPQAGGQLGDEYPHRHMFRTRLTGSDFGDPIAEKGEKEYFSKNYSYVLPDAIGDVATDPVNTVFLVFVTEGETEVVKVAETRPDTSALEQPFIAGATEAPIGITKNHALDYYEIYLDNYGGIPLTTATFNVTLNGRTETAEWTGTVAPHTSSLVRVPLGQDWSDAVDSEGNEYAVRLMTANGKEVETASIRGKFNEIFTYPTRMTVKIKTDLDAADNTWRIVDRTGATVKEFGPYADGIAEEYTEELELQDGEIYGIEITDCWGDGVRHPLGSFRLYDTSGSLVAQIKEIDGWGLRQFFRAEEGAGISNASADNAIETAEYYDLCGRLVSNPSTGVYIVRKTYSDGRTVSEKTMIR